MGASQSSDGPRVLTVEGGEGDEDTTVTVTQDFVNYVSSVNGESGKEPSHQPPEKQEPPEYDPYVSEPLKVEDLLGGSSFGSSNEEPTDDAWKWKQLYEQELEKNYEYKKVTKESFEEAANLVEKQLSKSSLGQLVPVCKELENQVLDCYKKNPKRTLNCTHEVALFRDCVQNARTGTLVPNLEPRIE